MRKYVTQMLDDINKDPKAIEIYKGDAALKLIFEYAFDPAKKMQLPEGDPPFKACAEPMGMTPTNLFSELRRLYIFCREDLKPLKRETLFVSLLEGVHPEEATMLLAVKDQTLHKLYKKITHKLVFEAGMITVAPATSTPKKAKAPETGAET